MCHIYIYNYFKQNLPYWRHNQRRFIVNYLLLRVLRKFWCKLSEDGDDAKHEGTKELKGSIACRIVRLLVLPEL